MKLKIYNKRNEFDEKETSSQLFPASHIFHTNRFTYSFLNLTVT